MEDCLFCKICAKELPSTVLYEDEEIMAIRDISPAAPVHVLILPKRHIASMEELTSLDGPLLGKIFETAAAIARQEKLGNGWRMVSNVGAEGGQSVDHLHFHLLGGRQMAWPPG